LTFELKGVIVASSATLPEGVCAGDEIFGVAGVVATESNIEDLLGNVPEGNRVALFLRKEKVVADLTSEWVAHSLGGGGGGGNGGGKG
jgi:hypothetical protein